MGVLASLPTRTSTRTIKNEYSEYITQLDHFVSENETRNSHRVHELLLKAHALLDRETSASRSLRHSWILSPTGRPFSGFSLRGKSPRYLEYLNQLEQYIAAEETRDPYRVNQLLVESLDLIYTCPVATRPNFFKDIPFSTGRSNNPRDPLSHQDGNFFAQSPNLSTTQYSWASDEPHSTGLDTFPQLDSNHDNPWNEHGYIGSAATIPRR